MADWFDNRWWPSWNTRREWEALYFQNPTYPQELSFQCNSGYGTFQVRVNSTHHLFDKIIEHIEFIKRRLLESLTTNGYGELYYTDSEGTRGRVRDENHLFTYLVGEAESPREQIYSIETTINISDPRDSETDSSETNSEEDLIMKHSAWAEREVKNGASIKDVVNTIDLYEKHKSKLKNKDIYQWNCDDLRKELNEVKNLKSKRDSRRGDYDVIFENDHHVLVRCNDRKAMQFWGTGTQWCVTEREANHYESYVKEGNVFYVYVNKNPDGNYTDEHMSRWGRICIQKGFGNFGSCMFWDAKDVEYNLGDCDAAFTSFLAESDAIALMKNDISSLNPPWSYRLNQGKISWTNKADVDEACTSPEKALQLIRANLKNRTEEDYVRVLRAVSRKAEYVAKLIDDGSDYYVDILQAGALNDENGHAYYPSIIRNGRGFNKSKFLEAIIESRDMKSLYEMARSSISTSHDCVNALHKCNKNVRFHYANDIYCFSARQLSEEEKEKLFKKITKIHLAFAEKSPEYAWSMLKFYAQKHFDNSTEYMDDELFNKLQELVTRSSTTSKIFLNMFNSRSISYKIFSPWSRLLKLEVFQNNIKTATAAYSFISTVQNMDNAEELLQQVDIDKIQEIALSNPRIALKFCNIPGADVEKCFEAFKGDPAKVITFMKSKKFKQVADKYEISVSVAKKDSENSCMDSDNGESAETKAA